LGGWNLLKGKSSANTRNSIELERHTTGGPQIRVLGAIHSLNNMIRTGRIFE
jgi:hypothetical protein